MKTKTHDDLKKEYALESDPIKRKEIVKKMYEKVCWDADATVAMLKAHGKTSEEIWKMSYPEVIKATNEMIKMFAEKIVGKGKSTNINSS